MVLTGQDFLHVLEEKRLASAREVAEETGASTTSVMWRARELKNDGAIGSKLVGNTVVYFPPDVADAVEPPKESHNLLAERDVVRERGKMKVVMESIEAFDSGFTAREVLEAADGGITKKTVLSNLRKLEERGLVVRSDSEGYNGAQMWENDGLVSVLERAEIKSVSYRNEWENVREEVIERDDYECVNCGSTPETFHIHHDPPVWDMGRGDGVLDKSNLHTYCADCHQSEGAWGN